MRNRVSFGIMLGMVAAGCGTKSPPASTPTPTALPPLGAARQLDPSTVLYEVQLPTGAPTNHVWIYLPAKDTGKKIPCVLIAPAGSRLFHGMALGEGDRPEHIPYAHAGFAVVAYELDGPLSKDPREQEIVAAAQSFADSRGGLFNARAALDYALAKVPRIDPLRIYIAGHSSAGTHALLVAAKEPRIKGCVAYAPAIDVKGRLGARLVHYLDKRVKRFAEFAEWYSPAYQLDYLGCPILVFHAKDDDVIPVSSSENFVRDLSRKNKKATLKLVDHGGHYDAMIQEGIPIGIRWLKSL